MSGSYWGLADVEPETDEGVGVEQNCKGYQLDTNKVGLVSKDFIIGLFGDSVMGRMGYWQSWKALFIERGVVLCMASAPDIVTTKFNFPYVIRYSKALPQAGIYIFPV